jgi:hypothetical protein
MSGMLNDMLQQQMYTQMGMDPTMATMLAISDNDKNSKNDSSQLLMAAALSGGGFNNNNPMQNVLMAQALQNSDNPALTMMMLQNNNSHSHRDERHHSRGHLANRGREIFSSAYDTQPMPQQDYRQQQYMMQTQQQYLAQQPVPGYTPQFSQQSQMQGHPVPQQMPQQLHNAAPRKTTSSYGYL